MATETQTELAAVEGRLIEFIGHSRDVLKDELLHEIRRVESNLGDRIDGLVTRVDVVETKVDTVIEIVQRLEERQ